MEIGFVFPKLLKNILNAILTHRVALQLQNIICLKPGVWKLMVKPVFILFMRKQI